MLGIVPAGRLRTIQSFLHFDTSNATLQQVRELNYKLDKVVSFVDHLDLTIKDLLVNASTSAKDLIEGLRSISREIANFRGHALMIKRR